MSRLEWQKITELRGFYLQRPAVVRNAIDQEFSRLRKENADGLGYMREGVVPVDYTDFFGDLGSHQFLRAVLKTKSPIFSQIGLDPTQVLDIGTAKGEYLAYTAKEFGRKVSVHGVSAHDYQKRRTLPRNIEYRIADAENLIQEYNPSTFDFIVSAYTLRHMIDPLGDIAQWYELLKPGGVLLIEGDIQLHGIMDKVSSLVSLLQKEGYQIVMEYVYQVDEWGGIARQEIESVVIRKTQPSLHLPVQYGELQRKGSEGVLVNYNSTGLPEDVPTQFPQLTMIIRKYPGMLSFIRSENILSSRYLKKTNTSFQSRLLSEISRYGYSVGLVDELWEVYERWWASRDARLLSEFRDVLRLDISDRD